jgi:HAD superfamily hydrolase (TIGR01490 family)
MKPFAAFDIDGTFIRWQLFHAIVHSLGKHGLLPADTHDRIRAAHMEWKQRTTYSGFAKYEGVLVREYLALLKDMDTDEYKAIVQDVFDKYKDQTFTYTRDLAKRLKADGYVLLAISGSHHEIVEKLAAYHGFDVAVGATLEQINGKFSGKIDTPIVDKAKVLKRLIEKHGLATAESYAVGDSTSDAPMLEMVDNPIAFNPDKKYFAIASERKWKIVVERKNMVFELENDGSGYRLNPGV